MRVKCFAQEHNTVTPAVTQTRTTQFEAGALTIRPSHLTCLKTLWHNNKDNDDNDNHNNHNHNHNNNNNNNNNSV